MMWYYRLLEELYLSEKRYGELLKMFLSERQEQSQHLADQLGVPLPPLLLGATNTPAGKRLCQEEGGGGGAATYSPASTLDSTSSANTMTAEVSESETGGLRSLFVGIVFTISLGNSLYCFISQYFLNVLIILRLM